jgi:hypothetical protein
MLNLVVHIVTTGLYGHQEENKIHLTGRRTYNPFSKPVLYKVHNFRNLTIRISPFPILQQLTLTYPPTTSDISAYVVKHTQFIFKLRNVTLTKTWELQIWVPVQEAQCVIGTATETLITSSRIQFGAKEMLCSHSFCH